MLSNTRRLVVNADDFGLSSSVNTAVTRAHQEGILTTASLMVNEPGFQEAVGLARQNPALGVGLHLTFTHGHSTLEPNAIPALVNAQMQFGNTPTSSGMRFFFFPSVRRQVHAELKAQLQKFRATGLPMDHVNGHLHMHLHPAVCAMLRKELSGSAVPVRLTRDPLWPNLEIAKGRLAYRLSHWFLFSVLSGLARRPLQDGGHRHTERVFGLLQDSRVDEGFILALLQRLPAGDSELYSHPSLHEFKHEFEALISPRVKEAVRKNGIRLVRYRDL